MTGTNIENFAKSIGISVDKLIDYLNQAGIENKNKNDAISDDEKMQLLEYIRSTKSSEGKININNSKYKMDKSPIDINCLCHTCKNFTTAYLHLLFKIDEVMSSMSLELFFSNRILASLPAAIIPSPTASP